MAEKKQSKKKQDQHEGAEPAGKSRLPRVYREEVGPKVSEKFGIKNPMALPQIEKVTLNVNMGRFLDGTKIPPNIMTTVLDTLTKVSGQKPVVVKAKKSVSNFKVREGYPTSAMVTLRRDRMWHFLDRFMHLSTPRIKDFRGLSRKGFDRQGNYSTGLTEQGVFPEINMADVTFTHGMNINITIRNSSKEKSMFLLEELGMPFTKPDQKN